MAVRLVVAKILRAVVVRVVVVRRGWVDPSVELVALVVSGLGAVVVSRVNVTFVCVVALVVVVGGSAGAGVVVVVVACLCWYKSHIFCANCCA